MWAQWNKMWQQFLARERCDVVTPNPTQHRVLRCCHSLKFASILPLFASTLGNPRMRSWSRPAEPGIYNCHECGSASNLKSTLTTCFCHCSFLQWYYNSEACETSLWFSSYMREMQLFSKASHSRAPVCMTSALHLLQCRSTYCMTSAMHTCILGHVLLLREHLPKKRMFSFGHCPNYPSPSFGQLVHLFRPSKINIYIVFFNSPLIRREAFLHQ